MPQDVLQAGDRVRIVKNDLNPERLPVGAEGVVTHVVANHPECIFVDTPDHPFENHSDFVGWALYTDEVEKVEA